MKEIEFENILVRYPEMIEDKLTFEERQVAIGRLHVDLLYKDRFGERLIVELKRGPILREHIAQLFEYEGHFLGEGNPNIRIMLIGNRVPPNMRRSLEHHGFEWREFSIPYLIHYLTDKDDVEFLEYFKEESAQTISLKPITPKRAPSNFVSNKISEKFYVLFASNNLGAVLTRKEIVDMVVDTFPGTNRSSILPSDYCYNITNIGIKKFEYHLFEYLGAAKYRVLGKDYPFVGPILWKGKKIGEWKKGSKKPTFYEAIGG